MGSDPAKDKAATTTKSRSTGLILPEFYIGKYPVTNAQYAVFVQAAELQVCLEHWKDGQIPDGKENHPVVKRDHGMTRWRSARWLSETIRHVFRVCRREAEWEKAARGVDGCSLSMGQSGSNRRTVQLRQEDWRHDAGRPIPEGRKSIWCAGHEPATCGNGPSSMYMKSYPYNPSDGREELSVFRRTCGARRLVQT